MKRTAKGISLLFYSALAAETLAFSTSMPNAFTVPKVIATLLGAALLAPVVVLSYKRTSPIFLLQLLVLVPATVLSLNPQVSLWGGDWRRMGLITWAAILLVGAAVPLVIDGSKVRWTHFLRFLAATGTIAGLYGILQWLNLDPLLPSSVRENLIREFGGAYRAIGTIGQPTYFANYLLYPFFSALALVRFDGSRQWRRLSGIAAAILFAALLTTMSRGAIVGALVGLLLLIGSTSVHRLRLAAGLVLATVLAITSGALLLQTSAYGNQIRTRLDFIERDTTGGGRLVLWQDVAERLLPDFWLRGTGLGMFRSAFAGERSDRYAEFGPDVHWETAHNLLLDRWSEQGLAGLLMLLVVIATVIANARKALSQTSDPRERWAIKGMLCALISACIGNLFNGEVITTTYYLYLWTGLSFAILDCFGRGKTLSNSRPARSRILLPAIAAMLSCILVWHAHNNWSAERNLVRAIRAMEHGNEGQFLEAGRASAEAFPEKGVYALEFSNRALQYIARRSLGIERQREIAEIGIDYGLRAVGGDKSMLALYYISELGSVAGDPRTESWLRRLIATDPNWYRPHKLLASWLLKRQRPAEARKAIQNAQHFSPYDAGSAALGAVIDNLQVQATQPDIERNGRIEKFGRVPLAFEANLGQADPQIEYMARTREYTLYLNHGEALLAGNPHDSGMRRVRMKPLGAALDASAAGVDRQDGHFNYYTGDDPSKWRTDIPLFGKIAYSSIYPGIDLVYYGNQAQLEYDFVVSPGADHRRIALAFDGEIESLVPDFGGNLNIRTHSGILQLKRPHTYQQLPSGIREIPSRFVVDNRVVRFDIGSYDRTRPLTIDPILTYSTYLGGSGNDSVHGGQSIAVDASGNAFIVGSTESSDFPSGGPSSSTAHSAFVLKLNTAGTAIAYATYLGSTASANAVATDASGNAYITGNTGAGFPVTSAAPQQSVAGDNDAFIAKLTPSGSLAFSTYWGGSGPDVGNGIAIDASGGVVITGFTESADFQPVNAYQWSPGGSRDAFATKINPDGSLLYSTYLGGNGDDAGFGVAIDASGSAYVAGLTFSGDFPILSAFQPSKSGILDAFITRLDASGAALLYSTYLGGSGFDEALGIAVDALGNAYVSGSTGSSDFPGAIELQSPHGGPADGFVAKLSPLGDALTYSRYIGGTGEDMAFGIAVDASSNAYITGYTNSDVALFSPDQIQPTRGGLRDGFLLKLDPSGSGVRLWTYLGGGGEDYGYGIAVDASGNAYTSLETSSANFPTAAPFRQDYGGATDVAATKIGTASDLSITMDTTISSVGEGASVTYVVTVRNGGLAPAIGVTLHSFVPAGTLLSSLTTMQGQCAPEGSDQSLSCALGTINAGQSVVILLRLTITGSAGSTVSGQSWLTADSDDLYAANNAAMSILGVVRKRPGQITSH